MLSKSDRRRIDKVAQYFIDNQHHFESFAQSLMAYFQNNPELGEFIHFIKYRIKNEESLRAKLKRNITISDDQNLYRQYYRLCWSSNYSFAHGSVVFYTSYCVGYSEGTEV